jgi:protocatechuate 3,4-dioxygenase beta subunit
MGNGSDAAERGARGMNRREALGLLGAMGTAAMGSAAFGAALFPVRRASDPEIVEHLDCIVTPAQTEGPYFIDERLERTDIRLDPTTKAIREGLPLRLEFDVRRVDGNTCAPIPGAVVDVWQCDASGIYSDVRDFQGLFDTRGQKFLRGFQRTDDRGHATFATVYPGWYAGRAVHVHFKVRTQAGAQAAREFTSQLYFDEGITDEVHARPPYNTKGRRDTLNDRDGIYRARNSGRDLMLRLEKEGAGYLGRIAVGLRG